MTGVTINHISFDDVHAGNAPVHVTFSMNDCGDTLTACHTLGSGVRVVSGEGTSQLTLEGSIADINAYLFHGNLLWNPDGANNHEMGLLKIEIDDNGGLPGGNLIRSTVLISEICNPGFLLRSRLNDFSQVNFTNICNVYAGSGNDEITTSFSHQGATTTYDGGSGNDTIHLLFTPDQLAEILADPQMRCDLRSFVDDPCGQTLDLLRVELERQGAELRACRRQHRFRRRLGDRRQSQRPRRLMPNSSSAPAATTLCRAA